MENLRYKLTIIVLLGALAILGPVLSSEVMLERGWLGIPISYYFILLVWIGFIGLSGYVIQKSDW